MEQAARYWMWAKPKTGSDPRILAPPPPTTTMNNCYTGDSWEEQAFAEDTAGSALGGCVWPPRSYSCSFCRREFRSAQALGGHMNVHRRDRARLKQSPTDNQLVLPQNHPTFDTSNYSPHFLYNSNPNPNPSPELFSDNGPFVSPPPIRVSSPLAREVVEDKKSTTTLCFFSEPLVHKNDKDQSTVISSVIPPSWSSFIAEKKDRALDMMIKNQEKKLLVITSAVEQLESKEDCVTDDLSMSLNLTTANCRTQTSDEEVASCKRRRIETKLPLTNFVQDRSEVLKSCSGSVEELDLELRLGSAPKVT